MAKNTRKTESPEQEDLNNTWKREVPQGEFKDALESHRDWLKGRGGKKLDLSAKTINGINFVGYTLEGANLSDAKFEDCSFVGSSLQRVHAARTVWNFCDLTKTPADNSNFEDAQFNECRLEKKHFIASQMRNVFVTKAGETDIWDDDKRDHAVNPSPPVDESKRFALPASEAKTESTRPDFYDIVSDKPKPLDTLGLGNEEDEEFLTALFRRDASETTEATNGADIDLGDDLDIDALADSIDPELQQAQETTEPQSEPGSKRNSAAAPQPTILGLS